MDVLMPQLGETVAEGKIVKWFVKAGDSIAPGDNLFEIETDKTSMEVPATFGGTLSDIHFSVGETAKVGAAVATIATDGETNAPKAAPAAKPVAVPAHTPPVTPAELGSAPVATPPLTPTKAGAQKEARPEFRLRGDERKVARDFGYADMSLFREVRTSEKNYGPAKTPGGSFVTPLARRLASERGIDLSRVAGSGPHGRIVATDIDKAQPANTAAASSQFYLVADVEIGRLTALLKDAGFSGAEFSMGDFAVKAWASALKRVTPDAGTAIALVQISGSDRVSKVIQDAANKAVTAIAKDGGEGTGATTAVHVLTTPGIREFTAVVTPPYSSILAVGAARRAPVEAEDGSVKFVSVMTVTLSCDHRAVDSTQAAELLSAFKNFVESPITALL